MNFEDNSVYSHLKTLKQQQKSRKRKLTHHFGFDFDSKNLKNKKQVRKSSQKKTHTLVGAIFTGGGRASNKRKLEFLIRTNKQANKKIARKEIFLDLQSSCLKIVSFFDDFNFFCGL